MFLLGDKGRREGEEEKVSIKIKKRTKIRGVPGCSPEHLIIPEHIERHFVKIVL